MREILILVSLLCILVCNSQENNKLKKVGEQSKSILLADPTIFYSTGTAPRFCRKLFMRFYTYMFKKNLSLLWEIEGTSNVSYVVFLAILKCLLEFYHYILNLQNEPNLIS